MNANHPFTTRTVLKICRNNPSGWFRAGEIVPLAAVNRLGDGFTPGTAEGFARLVTLRVCDGRSKSEALDLAISESPDGYLAWRMADVRPSLVATGLAPTALGFVQLVALHASRGLTKSRALDLAVEQSPEAYRAWRSATPRPAL